MSLKDDLKMKFEQAEEDHAKRALKALYSRVYDQDPFKYFTMGFDKESFIEHCLEHGVPKK